jgi:hypothetical protein
MHSAQKTVSSATTGAVYGPPSIGGLNSDTWCAGPYAGRTDASVTHRARLIDSRIDGTNARRANSHSGRDAHTRCADAGGNTGTRSTNTNAWRHADTRRARARCCRSYRPRHTPFRYANALAIDNRTGR